MMIISRSTRQLSSVLPCCSSSLLKSNNRFEREKRSISSDIPNAIAPFFQYAAECNITQSIQWGMEAAHGVGVPWATTFVLSGVALRLLTSPFHVYSEKLLSMRAHAERVFSHGVLKKIGEQYKCELVVNENRLVLKTDNEKIQSMASSKVKEYVPRLLAEHNLQASRIQNLKICTVPVWIFSSFALRNIISSDFHPSVAGMFWVPDLLVPDPYYILPVAVGLLGFLNIYSQRRILPVNAVSVKSRAYDVFLGSFTVFAIVIMSNLPACIPLYWLMVSGTGLIQTELLRHPTIKNLFGIKPLPSDSRTPFRDLFFMRRK